MISQNKKTQTQQVTMKYQPDFKNKIAIEVGKLYPIAINYSECTCHMKIAGTLKIVELLPNNLVQIYDLDGNPFSMPVGYSEAGIYRVTNSDNSDSFYSYMPIAETSNN